MKVMQVIGVVIAAVLLLMLTILGYIRWFKNDQSSGDKTSPIKTASLGDQTSPDKAASFVNQPASEVPRKAYRFRVYWLQRDGEEDEPREFRRRKENFAKIYADNLTYDNLVNESIFGEALHLENEDAKDWQLVHRFKKNGKYLREDVTELNYKRILQQVTTSDDDEHRFEYIKTNPSDTSVEQEVMREMNKKNLINKFDNFGSNLVEQEFEKAIEKHGGDANKAFLEANNVLEARKKSDQEKKEQEAEERQKIEAQKKSDQKKKEQEAAEELQKIEAQKKSDLEKKEREAEERRLKIAEQQQIEADKKQAEAKEELENKVTKIFELVKPDIATNLQMLNEKAVDDRFFTVYYPHVSFTQNKYVWDAFKTQNKKIKDVNVKRKNALKILARFYVHFYGHDIDSHFKNRFFREEIKPTWDNPNPNQPVLYWAGPLGFNKNRIKFDEFFGTKEEKNTNQQQLNYCYLCINNLKSVEYIFSNAYEILTAVERWYQMIFIRSYDSSYKKNFNDCKIIPQKEKILANAMNDIGLDEFIVWKNSHADKIQDFYKEDTDPLGHVITVDTARKYINRPLDFEKIIGFSQTAALIQHLGWFTKYCEWKQYEIKNKREKLEKLISEIGKIDVSKCCYSLLQNEFNRVKTFKKEPDVEIKYGMNYQIFVRFLTVYNKKDIKIKVEKKSTDTLETFLDKIQNKLLEKTNLITEDEDNYLNLYVRKIHWQKIRNLEQLDEIVTNESNPAFKVWSSRLENPRKLLFESEYFIVNNLKMDDDTLLYNTPFYRLGTSDGNWISDLGHMHHYNKSFDDFIKHHETKLKFKNFELYFIPSGDNILFNNKSISDKVKIESYSELYEALIKNYLQLGEVVVSAEFKHIH